MSNKPRERWINDSFNESYYSLEEAKEDNPKETHEHIIHVIEIQAYNQAIKALKVANKQIESLRLINEHTGYQITQPLMNLEFGVKNTLKNLGELDE